MLLIYQNKDKIHYAYYIQKHLPYKLQFYSINKRGQELICAVILLKNKLYVVSSENDLNKLYKMPVPVRVKHFVEYKTRHIKKGLSVCLTRLGKRLNRY